MRPSRIPFIEPLILTSLAGIVLLILVFSGAMTSSKVSQPVKSAVTEKPLAGKPDTLKLRKSDSLHKAEPDSGICAGSYTGLDPFFEALASLTSRNFRMHIAYFGDSMIEGDLVTHPLRRRLQHRFGGRGIGFVPVTSPQPGFRNTIHQQFNDSWEVYSFNRSGLSHGYYPGLSGYVFESQRNAMTSFKSEPVYGAFSSAELLYSSDFETQMKLRCDSVQSIILLPPAKEVSAFTIPIDSACNALSVLIENPEPSRIYGINFENGPGIYVDNYAFRGNSGLPLRQIPVSVFSKFNNLLNNKLIILHFGLNVFTPGVADYHWYEMAMRNVINHIKAASPDIPILVISMPDRSALIDGEYATPAELPDFIRMQQRIAEHQQVAFFSLFDAMGGVNSMKNWVEGKTKLAGGDYTHPNGTGANRIAEMIFQFLLTGFDRYSRQTTQNQEKTPLLP